MKGRTSWQKPAGFAFLPAGVPVTRERRGWILFNPQYKMYAGVKKNREKNDVVCYIIAGTQMYRVY